MAISRVLLHSWSPKGDPTRVRLYVNGLTEIGADTKVWFEKSGTSFRLKRKDPEANWPKDDVALRVAVIGDLRRQGLLEGDGDPDFATLMAVAANQKSPIRQSAPEEGRSDLTSGACSADWRLNQAENLDIASIKIPGTVEFQVDHREPDELAQLLLLHPQAQVSRAALTVGDVAINRVGKDGAGEGWALLVERKNCSIRPSDFDRSITQSDKRLFQQVEALSLADAIGILILEGDVHRNSTGMELLQQIDGFLTFASVIQKVSIIPTLTLRHTAYVLLKLAQHQRFGLGYSLGLRAPKPKGELNAARYVLEGLPGINAGLAKVLLERFGSVRGVINATEDELLSVPGIGPQRVRRILACVS